MNEHSVMQKVLRIRRVTEADMPALIDAAKEDAHSVLKPTHVLLKEDKIVGYLSIGAVPVVFSWFSTKDIKPRDSVNALAFIEDSLQNVGANCVCIPCWEHSPFYEYMKEFGYQETITTTMFVKPL